MDKFLVMISNGLTSVISKEELFATEIKVSILKRIDKVFNKGLHFYLDPKPPQTSKESSIFFRKESFNSELNIGAKKIVNHFEEFKISLSGIAALAELNIERSIPVFSTSNNPQDVAFEIRKLIYPEFVPELRDFLKALISNLAANNVLVFEFVETWNKKERANIDGFYLEPNVIVLKRQQRSFRREIFTLAHELGHFLLQEEEVELLEYDTLGKTDLNAIERWCNDFAYYFLIGDYLGTINSIEQASLINDYNYDIIENISKKTHLSKIALYTRLLFENRISPINYNKIRTDEEAQFNRRIEEERKLRELEKEKGIKQRGSAPKPINSPLLISTIQTAFYGGVISEYEVAKRLNVNPEKVAEYIQ